MPCVIPHCKLLTIHSTTHFNTNLINKPFRRFAQSIFVTVQPFCLLWPQVTRYSLNVLMKCNPHLNLVSVNGSTASMRLLTDVFLAIGRLFFSITIHTRSKCHNINLDLPVTHSSRAIICVSTETWKNMTNHRGQFKVSNPAFPLPCPVA